MKTDCANCDHYDNGFCHLINARLGTQDGEPFPTSNGLGDEHCDRALTQRGEDGDVAKEVDYEVPKM